MKIEKGVPMPAGRAVYNFDKMEVGDSVFFEGQDTQGKACMAARNYAAMHGMKMVARSVEGGARVWRTK